MYIAWCKMEGTPLSSSSQPLKRSGNNNADSTTTIDCQKDMTNESEFNKFKSILSSSMELRTETSGSDSSVVNLLLPQTSMLSISSYRVAHCQKELGRYLVAAKDLEEGEIILQEFPIASGPERDSPLICQGCYEEPHGSHTCEECGWPLCSLKCPGISRHQMECSLLSQRYYQTNNNGKLQSNGEELKSFWKILSDNLMIIRCLSLKYFDPSKFQRLLEMETNYEQWSRSTLFEQAQESIQILREELGAIVDEERFTIKEMLIIQAVLDINAYEVRMPFTNIQASYAQASLAEHNCVPNMYKTISSTTLELTLRAAGAIPKGAHLTTSYCDVLWPTVQRQQFLQWSKFFVCKCTRCIDPTEVGSFLSALICPLCESPVLPIITKTDNDFEHGERLTMNENFNYDYQCSNCLTKFPASQVQQTLLWNAEEELQELDKDQTIERTAEYQKWMARWTIFPAKDFGHPRTTSNTNWKEESVPDDTTKDMNINTKSLPTPNVHQGEEVNLRSNEGLEKLLPLSMSSSSSLSRPQLLLHSHHSLVLDACHTLFLLLSTDEFATDEELQQKIQLGMHLIESTKPIFKGLSKFAGTIMAELGTAKMVTFMRRLEQTDYLFDDDRTRQLAQDSIDMFTASREMLKYEPLDQPEGILAHNCTQQLTHLTDFLENLIPNKT